MTEQITVPELGESVVEATVGEWHKQEGDDVAVGDLLVDLETDKVDIEVGAKTAGVLVGIKRQTGEDVQIGDVLAEIVPNERDPYQGEPKRAESDGSVTVGEETKAESETEIPEPSEEREREEAEPQAEAKGDKATATPVAQRLAQERKVDLAQIAGSGPNGRITRQDVENYLKQREAPAEERAKPVVDSRPSAADSEREPAAVRADRRYEERVRLSRRRRTIARRLVEAQQNAAILTTFNDVDMSAVIALRKRRGEAFRERHDVKLGFMSFFVKASIGALKAFPRLNAEIDGDEMVLKHYYDIGIAVGAEEGLVVPVVRNADRKSFAEIEGEIRDLARKARDGSLSLDDIRGGTFSITNGGVFGSLLSTPILNPPQVGIMGLHRIEDRPVAVNGEVVVRSMMYVALSYDHRLVDGREAVQFLARIKELIEDPETLLLEG